jgi:hypothetical protein
MQEDRRAHAGDRWAVIVAQDHDDVVDMIVPPERLGAGGIGKSYRLIVGWIRRIIAPAIILTDRANGEPRAGRRNPGSAIKHLANRPDARRRGPVALPFHRRRDHACRTQRAPNPAPAHIQKAVSRRPEDHKTLETLWRKPLR